MKLTFGLATLATLALSSGAFAASGCGFDKQKQAMSCAEGSVYDSATGTCVPTSS